jgi:hypothetical protein
MSSTSDDVQTEVEQPLTINTDVNNSTPITSELTSARTKHVMIAEPDDDDNPHKRNNFYHPNQINSNELHTIRAKERELQSKQVQRLLMQRNRAVERKKLSSAYAQTKTVVFPAKKAELSTSSGLSATNPTGSNRNTPTPKLGNFPTVDLDAEAVQKELHLEDKKEFDYGYHFVHSSGKGVSVARDLSSLKRPLHKEIIHKNTYFTPSLVEICAEALSENFESTMQYLY